MTILWRDTKHCSTATIGDLQLEVWRSSDKKAFVAFLDGGAFGIRSNVSGSTLDEAKAAAIVFARRALAPWKATLGAVIALLGEA